MFQAKINGKQFNKSHNWPYLYKIINNSYKQLGNNTSFILFINKMKPYSFNLSHCQRAIGQHLYF